MLCDDENPELGVLDARDVEVARCAVGCLEGAGDCQLQMAKMTATKPAATRTQRKRY